MKHVDIGNAFLNAPLDEVVYMEAPEGLVSLNRVCKVKKEIYGLPQAPKAWNKRIHESLSSLGLRQSLNDRCLYILGEGDCMMYLLLYVDDMYLSRPSLERLNEIVLRLSKEFKVKTWEVLISSWVCELTIDMRKVI